MVDKDGFRPNVGIVITDGCGRLLWAKRIGQEGWQFPQGGINPGEEHQQALYRELREEVGLEPEDVELLACTRGWLRYRLPRHMVRHREDGKSCVGQKQKWYLLRLLADESKICLHGHGKPEFDGWRWVSYWYPVDQVVDFKRTVYRRALKELAAAHSALELDMDRQR